jgi:hypothetical protein
MLGWLKERRRIIVRNDKFVQSLAAMVSSACALKSLRHLGVLPAS